MMSNAVLERCKATDRRRVWRWSSLTVLAVYWLGMFAGTHSPKAPHAPFGNADKWMHFSAYLGLAVLLSIAVAVRRPVSLAVALAMVALLAGYGGAGRIDAAAGRPRLRPAGLVCRRDRDSGRHKLLSARGPGPAPAVEPRSRAEQPLARRNGQRRSASVGRPRRAWHNRHGRANRQADLPRSDVLTAGAGQ